MALLQYLASAAPSLSPDFWGWLSGTLSVSDVISGSGLAFIVGLFATRKILTIADHRARVADLEKYYGALLKEKDDSATALAAAKDARYDEMRESRNYWREAHNEQRTRAEKAEDGVREFADEYAKLSNHLLGSIEQAAGGSS
ncbi:hypothetical protein [Curtobacterium sp. ISL-83]|uniref:hypothetical protein n=1 Tax=Curtobacterium sp. ISL-83 TaxID=2819145 RepID=UPI001BE7A062|nr:hypothetical protein [Curtobacterium sp. ISL-83]MBT2502967.1 hypothetical protein [Curtobacterium sp. ISL-83]